MNERIRKLAEHCDFYVGNEHYNESHEEKQRLWTEKFAELIVLECISVAKLTDPSDGDDYRSGRHWAGIDIRNHFGVEK